MADNFDFRDAASATKTKAAKDIGSGVLADKCYTVDGHNETLGAKADTPATDDAGTWSLVALFKRLLGRAATETTLAAINAKLQATQPVILNAGTSGGWTPARVKAAATTNGTSLKASAGQVNGYFLQNRSASERFVKVYDKASAPTVGTDTPLFTIALQAGAGANVAGLGAQFANGIAYAITAAIADADATAVSADDVHGFILWK